VHENIALPMIVLHHPANAESRAYLASALMIGQRDDDPADRPPVCVVSERIEPQCCSVRLWLSAIQGYPHLAGQLAGSSEHRSSIVPPPGRHMVVPLATTRQCRGDGGRLPDRLRGRRVIADTSETRIARYRRKADEARTRADQVTDAKTFTLLLEAADTWDRLAELERMLPQVSFKDPLHDDSVVPPDTQA